jgi:hypothetical protein
MIFCSTVTMGSHNLQNVTEAPRLESGSWFVISWAVLCMIMVSHSCRLTSRVFVVSVWKNDMYSCTV